MSKEAELALGGSEIAEQTTAGFIGVLGHLPPDYQLTVSEVVDLYADVNRDVVLHLLAEKRRNPMGVSPGVRALLQHMQNKKISPPRDSGVLQRLMADPQWADE